MDRYKCLEAFVKIVETGSVSRAARAMGVSKSTVSERLAQLERLVGQPLVARSTRKMSITTAGRRIYGEFRKTAAHLRTLEGSDNSGKPVAEPLRIASTTDIGAVEVAQVLADYCVKHEGSEISLSIGNEFIDPIDRGFDMAIHFRRIANSKLKVEEITRVDCGLFASPEYLDRNGRPTSPDELRNHACLGYMFQPSVQDWIPTQWEFTRDGKTKTIEVNLRARFNSGIAMRHFAVAGLGFAILPKARVKAEISSGQLEEALPDYGPPSLRLFAVYPRAYIGNTQIQSVLRFLRARLSKML